ncbi:PAS domain-containing protein [Candidatus Saganbacteria bacterium]|nr:PAS domain-containing protein [Candidatus Saganbacteria bacterium]
MLLFYPYFELLASLLALLFAFFMFTRHYENRVARFFARFALVGFLASILEYSMRIAFTLELAQNINRLSASFWAFLFPMFAHFCLLFAKKDEFLESRFGLFILYLPASLLTLAFLFTNSMYLRYEIFHYGIASQPAPLYWLFALNTFVYVYWGVMLLIGKSFSSPQASVRSQARLIAIGSALPALVALITDEAAPLLMGVRAFPPTCIFALAIMIFFIFLAMRRYALFAISPALAADVIIETMPDSLLVTDLDGQVILLNDLAKKFFHAAPDAIVGKLACELFKDRAKYDKLYDEVVKKGVEIERYPADLIDPRGEMIPCLINANKVCDALGATLGIVFVIRDIRG